MTQQATTDDRILAEFRDQIAPLADYAQRAEQLLGEIEEPLGALYQQAEQTGDDQMRDRVLATWEKTQAIAAQIPPFVAALKGGGAAIDEMRGQRDAIAGELSDLLHAIESCDTGDVRLRELVEFVEEDAYAEAHEDALNDSWEYTDMIYRDEFRQHLILNYDTSQAAIDRLIEALRGKRVTTEEQDHWLQWLLESLEPES